MSFNLGQWVYLNRSGVFGKVVAIKNTIYPLYCLAIPQRKSTSNPQQAILFNHFYKNKEMCQHDPCIDLLAKQYLFVLLHDWDMENG